MTYYCEINFKERPSFSVQNISADSVEEAKKSILQHARNNGFTAPVKKIIVKLN
jgi:predicted ATPase with chaperone activity